MAKVCFDDKQVLTRLTSHLFRLHKMRAWPSVRDSNKLFPVRDCVFLRGGESVSQSVRSRSIKRKKNRH